MIPKIIHFCWLSGDPYPDLVSHCIDSWKRVLPDYEFVLWDKNRFDVDSVPWVKEACEKKKWAFAADYIRLYALYNYGGIYLDSDVEMIKSFDELLDLPYFLGREHFFDIIDASNTIEAATIGAEKGNPFIKACLDYYSGKHFVKKDGELESSILPYIMSQVALNFDVKCVTGKESFDYAEKSVCLFPMDYFSPKNSRTLIVENTSNTFSVHHFNGSWHSPAQQKHVQLRIKLCKLFGEKIGEIIAAGCAVFIHIRYEGFVSTIKRCGNKIVEKIRSL